MLSTLKNGKTAISNEVLAVLGIARQGPIARYRTRIKTKEKTG